MSLALLTPWGAILALAALVPLAAIVLDERQAARVRRVLGLAGPGLRRHLPTALAAAAVPALLGLAATQPTLRQSSAHGVRADAQAVYVVDVSRSMLASASPDGRTRFARAVAAVARMHSALRDVPSGLATMTDRVLPDLLPTAEGDVFDATLAEVLGVDRPPPRGTERVGTLFSSLDALPGTNFFSPRIRHRLVVVLTDGESRPFDVTELARAFSRRPRTRVVVVRFWSPGERVWHARRPERGYRADPASASLTTALARAVDGRAYDERALDSAVAAARSFVGTGPVRGRRATTAEHPLARWIALAALVPLAALVWRLNLRQ